MYICLFQHFSVEVFIIKLRFLSAFIALTILTTLFTSCGSPEHSHNTDVADSASESETEIFTVAEEIFFETEIDVTSSPSSVDIDFRDAFHAFYQAGFATMDIENIMQEKIGMPNGCEAVSLSMALGYYGFDIDARILFEGFMPHGKYGEANPFYEYVGSPKNRTGYGCYAPCVVETANKFLKNRGSKRRAHDISTSSVYEILGYVWNGIPVIIWGTLGMEQSDVLDSWYFDGERVYWYNLSHCVLITGVKGDNFIICDPMVGKVEYPIEKVEAAYTQIYSQAAAIW